MLSTGVAFNGENSWMMVFLHASAFFEITALLNIPFVLSIVRFDACICQLPTGVAWLMNLQKLKFAVWNVMLPSKVIPDG